jgi:hypothetical protein
MHPTPKDCLKIKNVFRFFINIIYQSTRNILNYILAQIVFSWEIKVYFCLLIQEECASISFMSELDFMAKGDVTLGCSMDGIAEDV